MNPNNKILTFVRLIHLLIVLYVVFALFVINKPLHLLLYVTIVSCILAHWAFNSDVCALTYIENWFRGSTNKSDGFIQEIVAPIYNISNKDIHFATFCLLIIGSIKLYYSISLRMHLLKKYHHPINIVNILNPQI